MNPVSAPDLPTWPEGVTLLLGLGAQKAGTTWLHETLRAHPDCRAFPVKEVHYFDTIARQSQVGFLLTHQRIRALRKTGRNPQQLRRVERLAAILEDHDPAHQGYVDVMTERMQPGSVALDITPAYAQFDEGLLAQVARMDPVRFLFIMREPVARFWSNIRMMVNWQGARDGRFEDTARGLVDQTLSGQSSKGQRAALSRSDYAETLRKLRRHVPAHRRLVLFFEDLFCQATLDRIWAFLGLTPMPLTDTAPRLEGVPATLRPDQVERLTDFFRPQYEAVCAAFGDAVPRAWHARFAQAAVTP